MTKNYDAFDTFGEVFSAIISDRNIKSDEQLARKAMRVQASQPSRINIQRRTINNWRNNRSMPRSATDLRFQLVIRALDVSDPELTALMRHLDRSKEEEPVTDNSGSAAQPRKLFWMAISAALLAVFILTFAVFKLQLFSDTTTFVQEIPASELHLSTDGFVLPNSSSEPVTIDQLESLTGWELYVARNEIYARRGWGFVRQSSVCLQNHFNKHAASDNPSNGWYQQRVRQQELTNLERDNAETIRRYECSARGGQVKCNGLLNQCF